MLNLIKKFDLEYFDGPLISLFSRGKGEGHLLFKWLDFQQNKHQWLVFPVNLTDLRKYVFGKISELELITNANPGQFLVLELGDKQYIIKEWHNRKSLPDAYLPEPDVYFDKTLCPDLTVVENYVSAQRLIPKMPILKSNQPRVQITA